MTAEILDAEVVEDETPTVAALSPAVRPAGALLEPAAQTDQIEEAFRRYTDLCDRLLIPSDYQEFGSRLFRKKSAWRKLAVAFGVSCEILKRDYERDDRGRIVRAEVVVRATAPNGRSMDGLGACDLFEKCCLSPCTKKDWSGHTCCQPDCSGAPHFSHPQHDIPATASTRATNRACADLFGMGEVSAEEVVGEGESLPPAAAPPERVDAENPWIDVLGNPAGWFDNRESKGQTRRPDFKAKKTNVNWCDKGDRDGQPDPLALWIDTAPPGFVEALALRDQGLPIDWQLLEDAEAPTARGKTPAEADVRAANGVLRARVDDLPAAHRAMFVTWKNDQGFPFTEGAGYPVAAVEAMHHKLDEITGPGDAGGREAPVSSSSAGRTSPVPGQDVVEAGEAGTREDRDPSHPGPLSSPASDDPAQEAADLAKTPCALCGHKRTKRVQAAGGQVRCADTKGCAQRVHDQRPL